MARESSADFFCCFSYLFRDKSNLLKSENLILKNFYVPLHVNLD